MSVAPDSLIGDSGLRQLEVFAEYAPKGDFVEIGVYKGGSAWVLNKICERQGRTLHLFDTFEGIPFIEEIDKGFVNVGHFRWPYEKIVELFKEQPNVKIYKGVFPETMPKGLDNIAFVHVDCDIYRTMKDIIEIFPPIMATGGMMYFDDYGNCKAGVKAVNEGLSNAIVMGAQAVWYKK